MTLNRTHLNAGRFATLLVAAGLALSPAAFAQTQLPPPGSYGQADARQDRIEELEQQLRDSTAENERVQYELVQANREIARLRGLVGELASVNQSAVESVQQPAAQTTSPQGGPATPQPPPASAPTTAPQQTGSLGTLSVNQLPGEAGPAYTRARELLVNGNYAEAENAFGEFLQAFPTAETAADARFWYAFTLLARNNYGGAKDNFIQYLRDTPRGPRAPEAQVRLGVALAGLARDGENDAAELRQACGAFSSLRTRYPNAGANIVDLARREARAANCPA
jgi:TolA-binding protein